MKIKNLLAGMVLLGTSTLLEIYGLRIGDHVRHQMGWPMSIVLISYRLSGTFRK